VSERRRIKPPPMVRSVGIELTGHKARGILREFQEAGASCREISQTCASTGSFLFVECD